MPRGQPSVYCQFHSTQATNNPTALTHIYTNPPIPRIQLPTRKMSLIARTLAWLRLGTGQYLTPTELNGPSVSNAKRGSEVPASSHESPATVQGSRQRSISPGTNDHTIPPKPPREPEPAKTSKRKRSEAGLGRAAHDCSANESEGEAKRRRAEKPTEEPRKLATRNPFWDHEFVDQNETDMYQELWETGEFAEEDFVSYSDPGSEEGSEDENEVEFYRELKATGAYDEKYSMYDDEEYWDGL